MKVEVLTLCKSAKATTKDADIIGMVETLVSKAYPSPILLNLFYRIRFDATEPDSVPIQLHIANEDGETVFEETTIVERKPRCEWDSMAAIGIIPLNRILIRAPGEYVVSLRAFGQVLSSIPLRYIREEGS